MFTLAMFDASYDDDVEIARHEVSEDGVHWRPFDAERDRHATLHKRIEFARESDE